VAAAADSALRARGVPLAGWSRTLVAQQVGHPTERRFLRDTVGRVRAAALARRLAGSYLIPAQWEARYVRRDGALAARREEWRVALYPDGRVRRVEHDVADDAPGAAPAPDAARALARAAVAAGVAGPGVDVRRIGEAELNQVPRPRRLDTAVEYVDSAAALPGGATGRVVVRLAGTEAVGGGRSVRLPDAWTRRDTDRQSRLRLAAGVAGLFTFGGLVTLVVRGGRRRPTMPPVVTRRVAVLVGLAGGLVSLAASVNGLTDTLAGWGTEMPWGTFVGTTAVATLVGASVAGLTAGALWAGVDALRRRAGVPFWPRAADGAGPAAAARDALLLGAALGLAPAALELLAPLARAGAWPEGPATTLDRLAPWAAQVLRALQSLLWAPAAALPAAALAAGLRSGRARLAAVAVAALAFGAALAVAGGGELAGARAVAASLGAAAATAGVVWAFGRGSALAWLAAPPAAAVALGVAGARAATNATDAASAALGAAAGAALLAALHRWAARRGGEGAAA
jgi:hypothetical protein